VATFLAERYGNNYQEKNLRRMVQFAERFADLTIVATLARQLSWSHFKELIPIKDEKARFFYAAEASNRDFGVRELHQSIERREFERTEIANIQLTNQSSIPLNVFKDPYFLDFSTCPKIFSKTIWKMLSLKN
jgi:hypothetical protein